MGDRGKTPERELFTILDQWKSTLAEGVIDSDPALSPSTLEALLNRMLLRLLWLKLCEYQGSLAPGTLFTCSQEDSPSTQWSHLFQQITHLGGMPLVPSTVKAILLSLHHLTNPTLSRGPSDSLGLVYEYLLNHPIQTTPLTSDVKTTVPNPKKSRGIYYTPPAIVEEMIEQTLGKFLHGKTVEAIASLTILDPACGSGTFLVQAYQSLLGWYQQHPPSYIAYIKTAMERTSGKGTNSHSWPVLSQHPNSQPYQKISLPWNLKRDILQRHIYGVDVDQQAVEITYLSLLLVLFEGFDLTPEASIRTSGGHNPQFHRPDHYASGSFPSNLLTTNIQWGNAVIGPDIVKDASFDPSTTEPFYFQPFDWHRAFPSIMQRGGFDIVLGNPPYVDAEWMTRYQPLERHYCAARYATASGNWDLFCIFCEKALQVCQPHGLTSFIVPNKLGAASYAQALRHLLTVDNQLLSLKDYSDISIFPIAVYPLVYVVQKTRPTAKSVQWQKIIRGPSQAEPPIVETRSLNYTTYFSQPQRPWAIATTHQHQDLLVHIRNQGVALGDVATVCGAATVAEAYAIKPLLHEVGKCEEVVGAERAGKAEGAGGVIRGPASRIQSGRLPLKFINSGAIDAYRALWGQKSVRYLGDRYQAPIIPLHLEAQLPPRRCYQARQPKLIVASMTLGLEGVLDPTGAFLAGKSTTIITSNNPSNQSSNQFSNNPSNEDLRYLLAILNSSLMSFYYRTEFSGNALSGGYLRVGPPQLKTLPVVLGTAQQRQIIIELVDALVTEQQAIDSRSAKRVMDQRRCLALTHQLDRHIAKLYGLSPTDLTKISR